MAGTTYFQVYERNLRKVFLWECLQAEQTARLIADLKRRNAALRSKQAAGIGDASIGASDSAFGPAA